MSRGVDGDVAGKERVECGGRCDDGSFGAAWTPHRPSTAARNINWFTDSDHTDTDADFYCMNSVTSSNLRSDFCGVPDRG